MYQYVIYVHGLEVESTRPNKSTGMERMIHFKDSRLGPPGYTLKNSGLFGTYSWLTTLELKFGHIM